MSLRSLGRVFGYDLALDPGSESVRALARSGGIAVVPSVLAGVRPSLGGFLRSELVGSAALAVESRTRALGAGLSPPERLARAGDEPGPDVRIVRPVSRGAVQDIAAAERLFAHVFQEAPRRTWGARPRVLAGLGACSTPVERRALAEALDRAGAKSVSLVPALAPLALALERAERTSGAGARPQGAARLIVELGAERTGLGVASPSGVIVRSSLPWGSSDLDRVLAGRLRRRGLAVSAEEAGDLRKGLGLPAASHEAVSREAGGRAREIAEIEDVLPRDVGDALSPFIMYLADEIRSLIARAPEGAADDLLDLGAVLAGGPAATPGLAEFLAADLDIPVRACPDPADLRVKGLALLMDEPELLTQLALEE